MRPGPRRRDPTWVSWLFAALLLIATARYAIVNPTDALVGGVLLLAIIALIWVALTHLSGRST